MVGQALWIFGYGSLVWRPAFPHVARRPGLIRGWSRRFWQGSTDHRGTPDAPGRVVTLVPDAESRCWGIAYQVDADERERVLEILDHRERGGFERVEVEVEFAEISEARVAALVYIATETNPNYLGPAPIDDIAEQIRGSHGPSGPNPEYALRLADALRQIDAEDDHVFAVARKLRPDPGTL